MVGYTSLQGSGAVCAPLRERDLELDGNRASTARRVPHSRRLSDGAGAQTPQRFVWELDLPLDEGRARGVWPSLREGLHQYTPCNDRDVCGESANISGVPGGGTEERVNAAPVVVGNQLCVQSISNLPLLMVMLTAFKM